MLFDHSKIKQAITMGNPNNNPDNEMTVGVELGCCGRQNTWGGKRGGALVGKPRWARILAITVGSSMAAMIFSSPPQ